MEDEKVEVVEETQPQTESQESAIMSLLTEIQSSLNMLTEQVTAQSSVADEPPAEEVTEDEKVEVEPEGGTDDTTEEQSPEEVEKMLFEN